MAICVLSLVAVNPLVGMCPKVAVDEMLTTHLMVAKPSGGYVPYGGCVPLGGCEPSGGCVPFAGCDPFGGCAPYGGNDGEDCKTHPNGERVRSQGIFIEFG